MLKIIFFEKELCIPDRTGEDFTSDILSLSKIINLSCYVRAKSAECNKNLFPVKSMVTAKAKRNNCNSFYYVRKYCYQIMTDF